MNKTIKDIQIKKGMTVKELTARMADSGFQAQNLGKAIEVIKEMKKTNAKIYLTFTSNMAASGLRGIFKDLVKNRFVDVIVTSSGTIDEDFIKCNKPYLQGTFEANDEALGKKGINRMGNIFVPNDRYAYLDDEIPGILFDIYKEKKELTPSELIYELGKRMDSDDSIIYWAAKNKIPIFCPGVTDGAFGMQLYFFQQNHPDFKIDVVKDLKKIVETAVAAEKTGAIILGGGIAKHHAIIANLMRDGFDYAVYIISSSPYRGSLSSATTEEAKSWGKIRQEAKSVTIHGDAAILFPLIIASIDL